MKRFRSRITLCAALLTIGILPVFPAQSPESPPTTSPGWLTQPLSLQEALTMALLSNSALQQSARELEAAHGVAIQTRAIALPRLRVTGNYEANEAVERIPVPLVPSPSDQNWSAGIRVIQSIYEGGRLTSSLRAARLTREQALLQHQTIVADTLLNVRVAYDGVLLAAEQIRVQEASVALLEKELETVRRRFEAGAVPRFNVLRAEVELANAKPRLIRARNAHRIAKNNLVNVLGYNLPREVWEDIPLNLTDTLTAEPFAVDLPGAISQALEKRTELHGLRKAAELRKEAMSTASATAKPSVQLFAGYGARNEQFATDLSHEISGWNAGAQVNWDIFDGLTAQGRRKEARARYNRARLEVDDVGRRIELEVRTAYSAFVESREVLESQKKVQEQAEEALRLAISRSEAGTGIQLDVLNAQTALTEARSNQIQALHDYRIARARLERAIGAYNPISDPGK